jgi:hypothetical protein
MAISATFGLPAEEDSELFSEIEAIPFALNNLVFFSVDSHNSTVL